MTLSSSSTFIQYSVFHNYLDTNPKENNLPIEDFEAKFLFPWIGEKSKAPAFCLARYGNKPNDKGNLRHGGNVKVYTGIVLDIDNKGDDYLPFDKARKLLCKRLGDNYFILHTTHSSTPDRNRLRIIIPVEHEIRPEDLPSVFKHLKKILKPGDSVDASSASISQVFLYPACTEGNKKYYRFFINDKARRLFDSSVAIKQAQRKRKNSKKTRKKSAKSEKILVPTMVDLDSLQLASNIRHVIETGDASQHNGDRSTAYFKVIQALINKGVDDNQIASIVLDKQYGISKRFRNKGVDWTFTEIQRARDKTIQRGLTEGIQPFYPDQKSMSVSEAANYLQPLLKFCVDSPKGIRGIKAPAGIGKTTLSAQAIADSIHKYVEIYVPNHKLAEEWRDLLIDAGLKPDQVQVIKGRTYKSEDSGFLCKKHELVEQLGKNNISAYYSLCRNQESTCEHFETCSYLAQYKSNTRVRIFTHAHLALERGLLDQELPDFIVIDEAFWQGFITIETITREAITRFIKQAPLRSAILKAFDAKIPLIEYLRKKFKTKVTKVIESAIEKITLAYPDIHPSMSDDEVTSKLSADYKQGKIVQKMLTQLLTEIQSFPQRKHSRTLLEGDKGFVFASRKLLTRFSNPGSKQIDVPIICIDANLDKSILQPILPGIRTVTISVKRNAHITQCYSTSNAKSRYQPRQHVSPDSKEARAADHHIENMQLIINNLAEEHKNILIATYQQLLEILHLPTNCQGIHFGGLRGLDKFKDCEAVIVIGRNQPPISSVENMAAALYWDDDDDLVLTRKRTYEVRGYRLTNGSQLGVSVMVCADPKVQRLMEQFREDETLQAIDRIRLIHNEHLKYVYILCNLPLDIDVDKLLSLKQMRTGGSHIEQILADWPDEILPLSPTFLHETFPERFKTLSAAKQAAAELSKLSEPSQTFNGNTFTSQSLDRSYNIWEYRIEGARGHNLKAIAPVDASSRKVQFVLEKLHNKAIIIKTPDNRLSLSYRKRRRFSDLTPRVHQHQEYEFEYLDHLEFDPDVPGGWFVDVRQAA